MFFLVIHWVIRRATIMTPGFGWLELGGPSHSWVFWEHHCIVHDDHGWSLLHYCCVKMKHTSYVMHSWDNHIAGGHRAAARPSGWTDLLLQEGWLSCVTQIWTIDDLDLELQQQYYYHHVCLVSAAAGVVLLLLLSG